MRRIVLAMLLLFGPLLLFSPKLHADLKRAMAEPNLERRSGLALENAAAALKSARAAYDKGDNDEVAKDVAEVLESVDLAATSLEQKRQESAPQRLV
jgi:hypothetical protein